MVELFNILSMLLSVVSWIIIIQAILGWLVVFNVINRHSDFMRNLMHALDRITEPLYRPFRKIMPEFGGIDFTPLVVLLLIMMIQRVLLPLLFFGPAPAPY
jgi:YggT family protein